MSIWDEPNPSGSPIEKLKLSRRVPSPRDFGRYLLSQGVDPDTAQRIGRAVNQWRQEGHYDDLQSIIDLEQWANIHSHPGSSGGGGFPEPASGTILIRTDNDLMVSNTSGSTTSYNPLSIADFVEDAKWIPDGGIVACWRSSTLIAMDEDGTERWNFVDPDGYSISKVAVDADSNIYAAWESSSYSSVIRKFDPGGSVVWTNSSAGVNPDVSYQSQMLVVLDRIFVCGHYNYSTAKPVRTFDTADGSQVGSGWAPTGSPWNVSATSMGVDSSGNIYVSVGSTLYKLDNSLVQQWSVSLGMQTNGIVVTPDDRVFVAGSQSPWNTWEVNPSDGSLTVLTTQNMIIRMTCDSTGVLYCLSGSNLYTLDPDVDSSWQLLTGVSLGSYYNMLDVWPGLDSMELV